MKIQASHRYNANVDTVFALFSESDFYIRKFAAVGAKNIKMLEFQADGADVELLVQRDMPANAPSMIKAVIGEWNTLIQKESWGGDPGEEYWNEFSIDAKGAPVAINGSMMLRADSDACVNDIELDIRCSVPLIGRTVEQFIAEDSEKSLAAEYQYIKNAIAS